MSSTLYFILINYIQTFWWQRWTYFIYIVYIYTSCFKLSNNINMSSIIVQWEFHIEPMLQWRLLVCNFKIKWCFQVTLGVELSSYTTLPVANTLYSENLPKHSSGTHVFVLVQNRQVFCLYRLDQQKFLTIGLYFNRLLIYSRFGLDRLHCSRNNQYYFIVVGTISIISW
jgi:hypothetical protein